MGKTYTLSMRTKTSNKEVFVSTIGEVGAEVDKFHKDYKLNGTETFSASLRDAQGRHFAFVNAKGRIWDCRINKIWTTSASAKEMTIL